jgi:hypothetical protein
MNEGSVQGLDEDPPADIQALLQDVGPQAEGSPDHARNRAPYVCQSQSTNFSCQRRRAARCRRFCSMGESRPRQLFTICAAGGSCTALHDRPQGPRRSGRRREDEPFCAVCSA